MTGLKYDILKNKGSIGTRRLSNCGCDMLVLRIVGGFDEFVIFLIPFVILKMHCAVKRNVTLIGIIEEYLLSADAENTFLLVPVHGLAAHF